MSRHVGDNNQFDLDALPDEKKKALQDAHNRYVTELYKTITREEAKELIELVEKNKKTFE